MKIPWSIQRRNDRIEPSEAVELSGPELQEEGIVTPEGLENIIVRAGLRYNEGRNRTDVQIRQSTHSDSWFQHCKYWEIMQRDDSKDEGNIGLILFDTVFDFDDDNLDCIQPMTWKKFETITSRISALSKNAANRHSAWKRERRWFAKTVEERT